MANAIKAFVTARKDEVDRGLNSGPLYPVSIYPGRGEQYDEFCEMLRELGRADLIGRAALIHVLGPDSAEIYEAGGERYVTAPTTFHAANL